MRSAYPERVAECLDKELAKEGKQFNVAAGMYAVDLAKQLQLLTANNVWTDLAQVLQLCSEDAADWSTELSLKERLVFFRLFLVGDGAALLFLAKLYESSSTLPPTDKSWASIADEMVIWVHDEYLRITGDHIHRMQIRKVLERRRANPYQGKSGAHQMFVHLQALFRFGFVAREGGGLGRRYGVDHAEDPSALSLYRSEIRSVDRLETATGDWISIASKLFRSQLPSGFVEPSKLNDDEMAVRIREVYDRVLASGVAQCAIRTVSEVIQIEVLASGDGVLRANIFQETLEKLRKRYPREVRIHVDQAGRPAFLILGREFPRRT